MIKWIFNPVKRMPPVEQPIKLEIYRDDIQRNVIRVTYVKEEQDINYIMGAALRLIIEIVDEIKML